VTSSDLPESIERLVGDRHGDLSALDGLSFDATIDVIAYRPSDVERLATALDGRGGTTSRSLSSPPTTSHPSREPPKPRSR